MRSSVVIRVPGKRLLTSSRAEDSDCIDESVHGIAGSLHHPGEKPWIEAADIIHRIARQDSGYIYDPVQRIADADIIQGRGLI